MDSLSFAQKQRLAYIDFKLYFTGVMTRSEIVSHFELGLAAATRDINSYKKYAPDNMAYDNVAKMYFITSHFKPLFDHDAQRTLIKLANNISDGFDAIGNQEFPVETPSPLNIPNIEIIAKLSQAIINNKAIRVSYISLTSGKSNRELVPHSIIDNGLRWHMRAYDRKSDSFKDFVLTRINSVLILDKKIETKETSLNDNEWLQMVPLQIVPHPVNIRHPEALHQDFGMENGMLGVKVRAAMAGYLLRRWNIDCSKNATMKGPEFQLYLKNINALDGVGNLLLAPGYQPNQEI